MAATAILDVEIYEILFADIVWRTKMSHRAKFPQNRSNGFSDVMFFISQDGSCRHLGFSKFLNFLSDRIQRAQTHYFAKFRQFSH